MTYSGNLKPTRGRDKFNKYSRFIAMASKFVAIMPKGVRIVLFGMVRNTRGNIGVGLRYVVAHSLAGSMGENVSIRDGVYIYSLDGVHIGVNVSIHPMCYIEGAGGVTIGDDVSIAHSVSILSSEHEFADRNEKINNQGCELRSTTIGDDVWIGAGVRVLAGAHISRGCIIAAGAVIKGRTEEYSIYGGIPARKIGER